MVLLNKGGVTCHFFSIFSILTQYLCFKSGIAALFCAFRERESGRKKWSRANGVLFSRRSFIFLKYGVLFYFFPVLTTRSRVLPERASVSLSSILVRSQLLKRATKRINNFQKFLKKSSLRRSLNEKKRNRFRFRYYFSRLLEKEGDSRVFYGISTIENDDDDEERAHNFMSLSLISSRE